VVVLLFVRRSVDLPVTVRDTIRSVLTNSHRKSGARVRRDRQL